MSNHPIQELIRNTVSLFIENGISQNEALYEIYSIIEHFTGLTKKNLIMSPDLKLNDENYLNFKNIVQERLSSRTPIQYLLGQAYFMGEYYYVDKNVLIPRPETEILVNETIKLAEEFEKPEIIDIGTGSGCIAISLSKFIKDVKVSACDVSEKALEIAKKNAKKITPDNNLTFIKSDLLSEIDFEVDIIVSNPPYIPKNQYENLEIEVKKHEPHLALFAEENGLYFYRNIIEQAKEKLKINGYIVFELGINQSEEVKEIFTKNGFSINKIIKDFSNIERVIIAKKNIQNT